MVCTHFKSGQYPRERPRLRWEKQVRKDDTERRKNMGRN